MSSHTIGYLKLSRLSLREHNAPARPIEEYQSCSVTQFAEQEHILPLLPITASSVATRKSQKHLRVRRSKQLFNRWPHQNNNCEHTQNRTVRHERATDTGDNRIMRSYRCRPNILLLRIPPNFLPADLRSFAFCASVSFSIALYSGISSNSF